MSASIDTAVILAAGLGSRLGKLTGNRPKGFLDVGGISLIERSCNRLADAGVKRILIGTGYQARAYEGFARSWHRTEMRCVFSEHYASTGSMSTLYNMRHEIDAPFLLLESDLLYEPRALGCVLTHEGASDCVILASGFTHSGDEVYIEVSDDGFLRNISKNHAQLSSVDAELVGISRVGLSTLEAMCDVIEKLENASKLHYEDVFAALAAVIEIEVLKIDGLIWCEIDNAMHLQRALTKILPFIEKN